MIEDLSRPLFGRDWQPLRMCVLCLAIGLNACAGEDSAHHVSSIVDRIYDSPLDSSHVRELIRLSSSADLLTRVNATAALGRVATVLPEADRLESIASLCRNSRDPSPAVRRTAFQALSRSVRPGEIDAEIILNGLAEIDSDVAMFAAELAKNANSSSREVIGALCKALDIEISSRESRVEVFALLDALGALGHGHPEAVATVEAYLFQGSEDRRAKAALALAQLDPQNEKLLPVVTSLFRSDNSLVRFKLLEIAEVLESAGNVEDAIAMIGLGRNDVDPGVRAKASLLEGRFRKRDPGVQPN